MRYTATEQTYFNRLEEQFGNIIKHDRTNKLLCFPCGVEYHYNCDAEAIETLEPNSDILFSGYCPKSWKTKGFLENRKLFRGCNTVNLGLDDTVVHTNDCPCYDTPSESEPEESEQCDQKHEEEA
jgi:hypothetical protein